MKVYAEKRIYGPYLRKDGRQIVIVKTPGKLDCRTVSYPKYLVECAIGRYLDTSETIDHIDGNWLNNEFSNLRIVPRSVHCRSHVAMLQTAHHICPVCGNTYICCGYRKTCGSKHCAGYYTHLPESIKSEHERKLHTKSYVMLRGSLDTYPTVEELVHQNQQDS